MHMIQTTNKKELISAIKGVDTNVKELYISARPSMEIVSHILNNAPHLQNIYCPPSLLKQTSTKVFSILEDRGIKLAHKEIRVGRPNKYEDKTVEKIMELRKQGTPVKHIAEKMNIPLRTVYFYLKK